MNLKLHYNLLNTAFRTLVIPVFLLAVSNSFAQVNLTKGLVAYYPFSGNDIDWSQHASLSYAL